MKIIAVAILKLKSLMGIDPYAKMYAEVEATMAQSDEHEAEERALWEAEYEAGLPAFEAHEAKLAEEAIQEQIALDAQEAEYARIAAVKAYKAERQAYMSKNESNFSHWLKISF